MDGEFIQQALRYKVHIKEQIPKLFGHKVVPLATKCVVHALRAKGAKYSGASIVARRFERIGCAHKGIVPESECIEALISGQGSAGEVPGYCVGAQDVALRAVCRGKSCVPLLFIRECVPILERPSSNSRSQRDAKLTENVLTAAEKKAVLEARGGAEANEQGSAGRQRAAGRKRRRGPKQPNPLSVKKKRKKLESGASKRKAEVKCAKDASAVGLSSKGIAAASAAHLPTSAGVLDADVARGKDGAVLPAAGENENASEQEGSNSAACVVDPAAVAAAAAAVRRKRRRRRGKKGRTKKSAQDND